MSNNNFLTTENFNFLYKNIKDIILSRDSFDISNRQSYYKKILKKLVLSIYNKNQNKKDINILNNLAINKCVPFLIGIIHKDGKNKIITPYQDNEGADMIPESFKTNTTNHKNKETNEEFNKRFAEIENERKNQLSQQIKSQNNSFTQKLEYNPDINTHNQVTYNPNIKQSNDRDLTYNPNIIQSNDRDLTYNPNIIQSNDQDLTYNPNIKQSNIKQSNNKQSNIQPFNGNSEDDQTNNLVDFFEPINDINSNSSNSNNNFVKNLKERQEQENKIQNINTLSNYQNIEVNSNQVNKNFIIDTGTSDNSHVQNLTSKYWSKFKAILPEEYIANKRTLIYLENITILGISEQYTNNILIKIDEIITDTISNNKKFNNVINISNTSKDGILNLNTHKYVGYIENKSIKDLTITIMNQDLKILDNGDGFVFKNSNMKNRIIMELSFLS